MIKMDVDDFQVNKVKKAGELSNAPKDEMSRLPEELSSDKKCAEMNSFLVDLLPESYEYIVKSFELLNESTIAGESQFKLNCRINIHNVAEWKDWLKIFSLKSGTSYNKMRADVCGTKKVTLSGHRKCIHNVRKQPSKGEDNRSKGPGRKKGEPRVPGMNTNCSAFLSFQLAGEKLNQSRACSSSLKEEVKRYPFLLTLAYTHNHSIHSADALRCRPIGDTVKEKLLAYFEEGRSPSSAYQAFKDELMQKYGDRYCAVSADRSIMPDYYFVFHLHSNYAKNKIGSINGATDKRAVDIRRQNEEIINREVKLKLNPVLSNETTSQLLFISHCATWESQQTVNMVFNRQIKWEEIVTKPSKNISTSSSSCSSNIVNLKRKRSKDLNLATSEPAHCNEMEQIQFTSSHLLFCTGKKENSLNNNTDLSSCVQLLQPEPNLQVQTHENISEMIIVEKQQADVSKLGTGHQKSMKCYVCGKLISKQVVNVNHNRQSDSKSYICKVCQPKSKRPMKHCNTSERVDSLNSSGHNNVVNSSGHNNVVNSSGHSNVHRNPINLLCKICGKHASSQHNLDQHMSLIHEDDNNVTCNVCGKQSSCRSKNLLHYLVHFRQIVYICEFCGREFTLPRPLTSHILLAHTGKEDKQCEICNQQFDVTQRLELNKHLCSHNGKRKFMCEICLEEFGDEKEAKNHVICHIQKRDTKCGICHRECVNFSELKKHLNAHDKGKGLFTCRLCQELFYHHDEMEKHMMSDRWCSTGVRLCRTSYINH